MNSLRLGWSHTDIKKQHYRFKRELVIMSMGLCGRLTSSLERRAFMWDTLGSGRGS